VDLGPHLIDQALVLFGEPQSIVASAFCQRATSEVNDAFDVCMEYSGLRAMLRARIIAFAPGPHLLIHGTKGSFVKYGMDPQENGCVQESFLRARIGRRLGREPEEQWGP